MDQRTAVEDLRPGKFVVAVLAASRKDIARPQRPHKAEHGHNAQRVKGQGIAKVYTNGVGTVLCQNRAQAPGEPGHGRLPGEAFVAPVCAPQHGKTQALRMVRNFEKARAFGARKATADRVLQIRAERHGLPHGVQGGDQTTGGFAEAAERPAEARRVRRSIHRGNPHAGRPAG
jgi:hypothetical protein